MVFTHPFGFLYGGIILLAKLIQNVLAALNGKSAGKRESPRQIILSAMASSYTFALSIILSWIAYVVIWLRQLLDGARRFGGTASHGTATWVPVPTLREAINQMILQRKMVVVVLALFLVAWLLRRQSRGSSAVLINGRMNGLLILSFLIMTLPIGLVYFVSTHGKSIFVDRYFFPSTIGWSILLAYVTDAAILGVAEWARQCKPDSLVHRLPVLTAILEGIVLCLLAFWLLVPSTRHQLTHPREHFVRPGSDLEEYVHRMGASADEPIVYEDEIDYTKLNFYAPPPSRYFFLYDPEHVVTGDNYPVMAEQVPLPNIMPVSTFLNNQRRFVYFDKMPSAFFEQQIATNPKYSVRDISGDSPIQGRLFLVEKR